MPQIENEASFSVAVNAGIHLMVGAGFSVMARDTKGRALPVGGQLADELRAEFKVDAGNHLSLSQLYTVLAARDREVADYYLKERFTVGSLDARYRVLNRLGVKTFFTTNIDDLPWRIYEASQTHYLNDVLTRGPVYKDRAAIDYVPLHGSVMNDERPYRFTSMEVASSFSANPNLWYSFRRRLSAGPTLFWGYSLQDAAALEALQGDGNSQSEAIGNNWIVLRPEAAGDPRTEYLRALRFQLILAETSDLLDYLNQVARPPIPEAGASALASLSQYRVPRSGEVAVRSITEFYAGSAPAWSDIFRPDLHRLEQYRVAENAINRGSDVVITGIPASGKTTLLMQLASSQIGEAPTLMLEGATNEAAKRLVRVLNGTPATVFIDNFCDDIDAWNTFKAASGVIVVGAERDYNIATINYRMSRLGTEFISMSEISELDLGAIRSRIPSSIRARGMKRVDVTRGLPSLLEFNLANTTSTSLASRLRTALLEFQRDEPVAAEMLLLVCYVHACRSVLSMDMALAYWQDEVTDYRDVYALVERVGKLLTEYDGELRENAQDYFAARSTVVADEALKAAGSVLLRRVLETFHYNLPTSAICRFDVFRRRGYSYHTISKAFPEVSEAVDFYDYLLSKDDNFYLLQQKALMLSDRGRFSESFVAIDQARGMTKGRNWTIRATHAEILFDANIHLAGESAEARKQVDSAMNLLRECYLSDRRRSLHAFSFSRKSLLYYRVFGDKQGADYLKQAREWLLQVQAAEPYMHATRWLLRDVISQLETAGAPSASKPIPRPPIRRPSTQVPPPARPFE